MAAIYARDNQLHGRGVNLAVISIVFTFVAICLVCSRLASRLTTGRKLHEDDYAIIASVVSTRFDLGLMCLWNVTLLILCHRSSQSVLVSAMSSVSHSAAALLAASRQTWLLSRDVHQTERCIGVAHGAGKVSTSLPPEDLRMALQVNQHQAEAALPPGAIFSPFVLRHSGQLRSCTNSRSP